MGILGEDALRDRYDRLSEGSSLIDEDAAYERLREALDEETMRKDTERMLLRLCDRPEEV